MRTLTGVGGRTTFMHWSRTGRLYCPRKAKLKQRLITFEAMMGMPVARSNSINLDLLDLPQLDLDHLSSCFTEQEVWNVIRSLPPDRAPRPDRFTARFLQCAWHIIRHDLMMVFDLFWRVDSRSLHSLNQTLMILLPKQQEASFLKNFWPISLIHIVGKWISKVLASRLSPQLPMLVHACQSAFITGLYI
jgi:hypothetical protein